MKSSMERAKSYWFSGRFWQQRTVLIRKERSLESKHLHSINILCCGQGLLHLQLRSPLITLILIKYRYLLVRYVGVDQVNNSESIRQANWDHLSGDRIMSPFSNIQLPLSGSISTMAVMPLLDARSVFSVSLSCLYSFFLYWIYLRYQTWQFLSNKECISCLERAEPYLVESGPRHAYWQLQVGQYI